MAGFKELQISVTELNTDPNVLYESWYVAFLPIYKIRASSLKLIFNKQLKKSLNSLNEKHLERLKAEMHLSYDCINCRQLISLILQLENACTGKNREQFKK